VAFCVILPYYVSAVEQANVGAIKPDMINRKSITRDEQRSAGSVGKRIPIVQRSEYNSNSMPVLLSGKYG
jgi:hypothetical protein